MRMHYSSSYFFKITLFFNFIYNGITKDQNWIFHSIVNGLCRWNSNFMQFQVKKYQKYCNVILWRMLDWLDAGYVCMTFTKINQTASLLSYKPCWSRKIIWKSTQWFLSIWVFLNWSQMTNFFRVKWEKSNWIHNERDEFEEKKPFRLWHNNGTFEIEKYDMHTTLYSWSVNDLFLLHISLIFFCFCCSESARRGS